MMDKYPVGVEVIRGARPGPKIGVSAVIHGDEPAGIAGLAFVREHFARNPLAEGEIWLIEGNIEAHRLNQRCVTTDMNRIMLPEDAPGLVSIDRTSYDFKRSRELMPIFAQLDYLLDLHNTTRESPPFSLCIASGDNKQTRLVKALPVTFAVTGFAEHIRGTTSEWVERHGGLGVTVECGYQLDPGSAEVAVASCRAFFAYLGFADFAKYRAEAERGLNIVAHEPIADKETFMYSNAYTNFDAIAPGEIIARDRTREYRAPQLDNMVIIFPVSIKTIREGSNTSAFFLAAMDATAPAQAVVHGTIANQMAAMSERKS